MYARNLKPQSLIDESALIQVVPISLLAEVAAAAAAEAIPQIHRTANLGGVMHSSAARGSYRKTEFIHVCRGDPTIDIPYENELIE